MRAEVEGGGVGRTGAGVEWGVVEGLWGALWCMSASSSATVFILRCMPATKHTKHLIGRCLTHFSKSTTIYDLSTMLI
jgi:hypothetical protein